MFGVRLHKLFIKHLTSIYQGYQGRAIMEKDAGLCVVIVEWMVSLVMSSNCTFAQMCSESHNLTSFQIRTFPLVDSWEVPLHQVST